MKSKDEGRSNGPSTEEDETGKPPKTGAEETVFSLSPRPKRCRLFGRGRRFSDAADTFLGCRFLLIHCGRFPDMAGNFSGVQVPARASYCACAAADFPAVTSDFPGCKDVARVWQGISWPCSGLRNAARYCLDGQLISVRRRRRGAHCGRCRSSGCRPWRRTSIPRSSSAATGSR